MYDVLYLDHRGGSLTLATHLDRDAATDLARVEARRRRSGRMFLAGSERPCRGAVVVIVDAGLPQRTAA
jgi:hypothetical protein